MFSFERQCKVANVHGISQNCVSLLDVDTRIGMGSRDQLGAEQTPKQGPASKGSTKEASVSKKDRLRHF